MANMVLIFLGVIILMSLRSKGIKFDIFLCQGLCIDQININMLFLWYTPHKYVANLEAIAIMKYQQEIISKLGC